MKVIGLNLPYLPYLTILTFLPEEMEGNLSFKLIVTDSKYLKTLITDWILAKLYCKHFN